MRTLLTATVSGAILALAVAACGSSSQSADTVPIGTATTGPTETLPGPTTTLPNQLLTTGTATLTQTATATTATPPATVTTTSVTTPDSGGAGIGTITGPATTGTGVACTVGDLTAAAVAPNSAPGTSVLGFTLTNSSSSPCHSDGWPGIALLGSGGQTLPIDSIRTTSDVLGATPQQLINLAPGQEASFRLTFNNSNGTASDTGCDVVAGVQIIPPDDTAALKAELPGGQTVDDCGTVRISPLQPGATGTGQ